MAETLHILQVCDGKIQVVKYGGIQRDVWYLGKELVRMGHRVSFLAGRGSTCDFAEVKILDTSQPLAGQISEDVDLVHSHKAVWEDLGKPCLITLHGNSSLDRDLHINTTFVSRDHAARFGSDVYVYNGLGLEELGRPRFDIRRSYVHFLGKAAWRVKNLKGCIRIAREAGIPLRVLGGHRISLNMGIRITLDPRVRFAGMVGGARKNRLLNGSKALLFPVLWNEPLGLSVLESLYFGCPVFGTPYGALPEVVTSEFGFLSSSRSELAGALANVDAYDRRRCHEYVCDTFSSVQMALGFLPLYEKVMNGEPLNPRPPRPIRRRGPKYLPFTD